MDRRAFIGTVAGGFLAAPLAAEAQQAGKVYRIGFLRAGQPPESYLDGFQHRPGKVVPDSRPAVR
jgi:hypothetical protein